MKPKICTHPSCTSPVLCKGLCRMHYWQANKAKASGKVKQVPRPPIAKLSAKRKLEEAIYQKLRLEYLNEHQSCEIQHKDCTHFATEIHHAAGRCGELLTDVTYFKASCRSCHRWVELNPVLAKEKGFSVSRLAK